MPFKRVFVFILLFVGAFVATSLKAQSRYVLNITTDPPNPLLLHKFHFQAAYADSAAVLMDLKNALSFFKNNGYLLAELLKVDWRDKHANALVSLGRQYKFMQINRGDVPLQIWGRAGFPAEGLRIQNASTVKTDEVVAALLRIYEERGYPFASIAIDSVVVKAEEIYATLKVASGDLIVLDTLQAAGDVRVSRSFLESYLDLESGSLYNEEQVQAIESRLNNLPFLKSVRKPTLKFSGNKARITLFLQKQNSNQFDGILGLLPDNISHKMQLTGDLKLHINNVFKRAETFDFNFKGLPGRSKELNLALGLAELFSSPLGADAQFNLYRQDTSFQNINSKLAIKYRLPKGNFSVFVHNRSGLPINSDTLTALIPEVAQVKYTSYGVGFLLNNLNVLTFPTRGHRWDFSAEAGRKKVSGLPGTLIGELPDKIAQYRIMSNAEFYLRLSGKAVFKLSNQTGLLVGNNLFENELYRIGGFNSLRGFNEQSILASNYSIFNAEYRFLIEQSSYLFAFFNQGLLESSTVNVRRSDLPFGFGTGISLQLKTGVFSLSYALGKAKDNPLNLQGGKIHFGLVTLF